VLRKRLKEESGYSLIEVLASMVLLTIAIIPMLGMFDTGLRGITTSSNYEKVRALANLKMEEAKSLPFDSADNAIQDVKDNFPEPAGGTLSNYDDGPGLDRSDPKTEPGFPNSMTYVIDKQYMQQPTASGDWQKDTSGTPTGLIRVTVTVNWNGNTYRTYGLVAE
jgi:Tfp pilus assembly protein PilV